MYREGKCGILRAAKRRCSILVGTAVSEEGPKNPFKGIAVKPFVPASYAQFGVGAERETRTPAFAAAGRSPMAWGSRPCRRGDLDLCGGALPCGTRSPYDPGWNLHRGAIRPMCRNAVCRVAFLAWIRADLSAETLPRPGQGRRVELFETGAAKEDRRR